MKPVNENLNEALGLIKETRIWMQLEKSRNNNVHMRQKDWEWMINRLLEAEKIIDPPKDKR